MSWVYRLIVMALGVLSVQHLALPLMAQSTQPNQAEEIPFKNQRSPEAQAEFMKKARKYNLAHEQIRAHLFAENYAGALVLCQQLLGVQEKDVNLYTKQVYTKILMLRALARSGEVQASTQLIRDLADEGWLMFLSSDYKKYLQSFDGTPEMEAILAEKDEWVAKAKAKAENGHVIAQQALALRYLQGAGEEKDPQKALFWLMKAAGQGQAYAQTTIGMIYKSGIGIEQDHEKAMKWFRLAVQNGSVIAPGEVGSLYLDGLGVKEDQEEAFKWFKQSAEVGEMVSQNWLAYVYRNGEGVKQDDQMSLMWLKRAAAQGDTFSLYELSFRYLEGDGVQRDPQQSFKLMYKAAEGGYVSAQYFLGQMYWDGYGVEKDETEALKWMEKAAESGDEEAKEKLKEMKQEPK